MLTKREIYILRSLRDKSARQEHGIFIAQGEKLITELVVARMEIQALYRVGENIQKFEMERISTLKSIPREIAIVKIPERELKLQKNSLSLVLDGVQDPGNMGTIIRTADWFGVRDIYCSQESVDCYSPKVVQATMGAIARVRVHYTSLPEFLDKALEESMNIYGTFLGDSENIFKANDLSPQGAMIVMGSEGEGISRAVEERVNHQLHIPSFSAEAVESLNVGVSAAIVLSEFMREQSR